MREKITKTESIYDGRVVKLEVHDVLLPDGNSSKREIVQHPGASAVVAIDDDNNILLVRQYRLPVDRIIYELPAGTLDGDENPVDCALRELQEETGYTANQIESIGGIYAAPGYTTEFIHLFFAQGLVHAPLSQDDDEFVESVILPFAQALAMVEDGTIQDSKSVVGILRASRLIESE